MDYQEVVTQLLKVIIAGVLSFAVTTYTHSFLVSTQQMGLGVGSAVPFMQLALHLGISGISGAAAFIVGVVVCFRGNPLRHLAWV